MNISLTPNQGKIFASLTRYVVAITGRRFGKSYTSMALLILIATSIPNISIMYVGLVYSLMRRTILKDVLKNLPPDYIKSVSNRTPFEIHLHNGSTIILASSKQYDNLRGDTLYACIIDEIGEQPEELFTEVVQPMLSKDKGRCWFFGTPKHQQKLAFYLSEQTDEAFTHFRMGMQDGGIVDDDEIEFLRRTMPDDAFRQEVLGEFVKSGGLAYGNYDRHLNESDTEFDINRRTIISFDFNVNPNCSVIVQQINPDKWVVVKDFSLPNTNTYNACQTIKGYLKLKGFNGRLEMTGDFSGTSRKSSSTHTDWQIIEKEFGNYNVKYNVTRTQDNGGVKGRIYRTNEAFLNDNLLINKKTCKDLDVDLISVMLNDDGTINEQGGKVSHLSDALSYFCMNFLQGIENKYTFR